MAGLRGRRIYSTRRWRRVRLAILDRDGWRCCGCGRSGRLEVHHRRPLDEGGAAFDRANLHALCIYCHAAAHAAAVHPEVAAWQEFTSGAE